MDGTSSDTKSSFESTLHTSQQARGEHHLAEGKAEATPDQSWGTEDAPTGLSTSKNMADPLKTSANLRGELSTAEGD